MKELPLSIGVISFVAGLVLLTAAIAVANLFTVEYRFPAAAVRMDTGCCEGRDCISLRAQPMAPQRGDRDGFCKVP